MYYCYQKGVPCISANDRGYCNVTACHNNEVINKELNEKYGSKTISIVSNHDMCSNCRHRWNDTCDKNMNPLTCDSWEPD